MDFIKVTEFCDSLDVCGQIDVIVRDGVMLRNDVALSVDLSGTDTYVVIERVEEVNGVLYASDEPGKVLYDTVLPGKITVQEIAGMSALNLLEVLTHKRTVTVRIQAERREQ
ncbi:hypothetical protein GNP92_15090 [Paenibacillus timonensis]|nr:hypothetical protein [Paenibacillus timonensis]MUG87667.1 hypothetical protein [Paenibacillus timonensis]